MNGVTRFGTVLLSDVFESEIGEFVKYADYARLEAEAQALREERDRIERNRDMWKGQCERQAEKLAALRARVVVPEGYALVPIELTRDMWVAVNKRMTRHTQAPAIMVLSLIGCGRRLSKLLRASTARR